MNIDQPATPQEELVLLDTPDLRPLWKKKKKELGIAGAIAAVVVGLIAYAMLTSSTGGPNPALATQQQQPEPSAVPTPPIVPMEMAPALQEQYQFYRFVHFLHEMEACPLLAKLEGGRDVEARALDNLGTVVRNLLAAYDFGECEERPEYAMHPERGKWLRYWATQ